MTTTPLMGLVLPDEGGSADVWDTILATLFGRVDSHNHTTGLGAKVPTGGLNIDADLSFSPAGTPRAITNLKAIDFSAVAASSVTSFAGAFFVSDGTGGLIANELYFRTTSGVNVRITSGAALNVAGFVGGIGGDYSAVGALLDYDDATDTYRFRQETAAAVRQFAKVKFADIQLIEYDPSGDASVPAFAVTIKSPDALAANYNLITPTALPGSTSLVQLDSAGQLSASNTVANAVALGASLSVGTTLNVTGTTTAAAVNPTTVTASGLITANAGVTAGANQHVTVSGAGRHKHGTMTMLIPHTAFEVLSGSTASWSNGIGTAGVSGVGLQVGAPVLLAVGHRILNVRFRIVDNVTGATTITGALLTIDSAGTQTNVATVVSAGNGTAQTITLSSVNVTLASSVGYSITAQASGAQSCSLRWAEVDYDLP